MAAVAHTGGQTPIQKILRTTAQHFGITQPRNEPKPAFAVLASEFKDPLPLRWGHAAQRADHRQFNRADLVTLR